MAHHSKIIVVKLMQALIWTTTATMLVIVTFIASPSSSFSLATLATTTGLASKTAEARSKVLEFNDSLPDNTQDNRHQLALQIIITEPAASAKKGQKSRKPPASILLARKRPYDLQETLSTSHDVIEKYTPSAKHFYILEPQAVAAAAAAAATTPTTTDRPKSVPREPPSTNPMGSLQYTDSQLSSFFSKPNDRRLQFNLLNKYASGIADSAKPTKRPIMNQASKLVRTQHRPPWLPRLDHLASSSMLDPSSEMEYRKYSLKFKTTMAPMIPTTEYFKLISSAHSSPNGLRPKNHRDRLNQTVASAGDATEKGRENSNDRDRWYDPSIKSRPTLSYSKLNSDYNYQTQHQNTATSPAATTTTTTNTIGSRTSSNGQSTVVDPGGRFSSSSQGTTTLTPLELTKSHASHPTSGSVTSPTIMLGPDEPPTDNGGGNGSSNADSYGGPQNYTTSPMVAALMDKAYEPTELPLMQSELDDRREQPIYNHTLGNTKETQLAYLDGKKIVTLVRPHKPRPPTTTTRAPLMTMPSRIIIQEQINENKLDQPQQQQQQSIRLISKQRHKYDDRVLSPTLTVVDNDAVRLPPNATSVHNNKLIVAIRPGRPNRRHPSTTQFPVYNMVAGHTNYTNTNPTQFQFTRPPSPHGFKWGLLTGSDAQITTTPSPSSFGAANIKFPAANPPPSVGSPIPSNHESHVVESIDKLNITVPASSSSSSGGGGGGGLVPDKILMETEEQHSRPPSEVIVMSNSTIVSRPYGTNTVNQDGIIRPSTTRRPQRYSTTKKINIVSANTTIVATNADQLHDVLSNFITGSHQQSHNTSQRPPERPGFFASLGNLLNASVTTSAVAILTLIKTIFVAVLVMFLPPIALTAAIMQAINIG